MSVRTDSPEDKDTVVNGWFRMNGIESLEVAADDPEDWDMTDIGVVSFVRYYYIYQVFRGHTNKVLELRQTIIAVLGMMHTEQDDTCRHALDLAVIHRDIESNEQDNE